MLWGWLRSYTPDCPGQERRLFAIEEVGELLQGKQSGDYAKIDSSDANLVPVSLKTQGSYISP